MDYDEQHRICEKELELDDAYTVAMDAMPEHWKEEADAQLTYLRNMHICTTLGCIELEGRGRCQLNYHIPIW